MGIPILSILVALSAALTIFGQYRPSKRLEYLFKPLTMALIISLAVLADDPVSGRYQGLIVAGLLASLAGDVFLMLPSDRFMEGLASFLVAHILYIVAFTLEGDTAAPIWTVVPFVLYGALMLWRLWPYLGAMRAPVILYMIAILIMGWQAANRWLETSQDGTLLALAGAYLFIASDSVLAIERFRGKFRSAPFWVLSTYFAAQWLIALSV